MRRRQKTRKNPHSLEKNSRLKELCRGFIHGYSNFVAAFREQQKIDFIDEQLIKPDNEVMKLEFELQNATSTFWQEHVSVCVYAPVNARAHTGLLVLIKDSPTQLKQYLAAGQKLGNFPALDFSNTKTHMYLQLTADSSYLLLEKELQRKTETEQLIWCDTSYKLEFFLNLR